MPPCSPYIYCRYSVGKVQQNLNGNEPSGKQIKKKMVIEAAVVFIFSFFECTLVMWYVTLLLIHFCMLSSGCNAYQACVDDLPSLSGPIMLGCVMVAGCGTSITDVEGWREAVRSCLASNPPEVSRCYTQFSLLQVGVRVSGWARHEIAQWCSQVLEART